MDTLKAGRDRVLVSDPEERVLQQVSITLERAGLTVFTALGRSALLEFCHHRSEPVDLAIVDYEMAKGSPELVRDLCRFHPGVRIMLTGSQGEPSALPEGISVAAYCGYLEKPFRRKHLLSTVLKAMGPELALTA